jgi:hypothetical protein
LGKGHKVYAPYGLEDLFAMIIRRNPARVDVRTYQVRIATKRYDQCWKSVKIIHEKSDPCLALDGHPDALHARE